MFSAAARPIMGAFGVGLHRKGSTAHDEIEMSERGDCWKRIEEGDVKQQGKATFIDVESGGGPVHASCPKQRVAKPGGANRTTEMIY
jgi:hypothetical protein